MVPPMQMEITYALSPNKSEEMREQDKAVKNSVHPALSFPDCTFEELTRRCNTETTVLNRILHLPLTRKEALSGVA
jgi:hypothetical protein